MSTRATPEEIAAILGTPVPPRPAPAPGGPDGGAPGAGPAGAAAGAGPRPGPKKRKLDAQTQARRDKVKLLLGIHDAYDFAQLFFPDLFEMLYPWQAETLIQLSGFSDPYNPQSRIEPRAGKGLQMTIKAANGSGKDQIVIAIWALYSLCCKEDFYWIGTSSSFQQLDDQTWKYIHERAEIMNRQLWPKFIEIRKHKLLCPDTGSVIKLFRTDEPGLTEGWHPLVPNGQMAIVLNECKSLEHDVIMAFRRCHGWTHWINISSPGDAVGYFFDKCKNTKAAWPAPLVLGQDYLRHVDFTMCPHLFDEYKSAVAEFTAVHPWVRSTFNAEFVSLGLLSLIPADQLHYKGPERRGLGLPRRAGLDMSDGGDATVISIWEGNYFVKEIETFERHEPTLARILVDILKTENVAPSQVYADAGHSGNVRIQRMAELGYPVNGVYNQSKPNNPKVYYNRGAELAYNLRRMILDKMLCLTDAQGRMISDKFIRQAGSRQYEHKDGKIKLEDKHTYRGRVGYSPDQLDAAVLAHAGCNYYVLKTALGQKVDPAAPPPDTNNWQKEWNEVYGDLDSTDKSANRAAWRTSGAVRRGKDRNALSVLDRRMGYAHRATGRR